MDANKTATTIAPEANAETRKEKLHNDNMSKGNETSSSEATSNTINIKDMKGDIKGKNLNVRYQDQSYIENTTNNNSSSIEHHYYYLDPNSMACDIAVHSSLVQKEEPSPKTARGDRQYNLAERQDCIDFIKKYKRSLHVAYAIALSIFEHVPVGDLQKLSESLLQRLEKEYDNEGRDISTHISSFISLDDITAIIGAHTCKISFTSKFGTITERCIHFEKSRDLILENLWELFPMMRSAITSWLVEANFTSSYRSTFSTKCLIDAIANIVKLDMGDSMDRLFQQLESHEKNKYLMIRLMLLLVEDESTMENACGILRRWASSTKWLWEVSLSVYSFSNKELSITEELEKTLTQKVQGSFYEKWGEWSIYFICGQMIHSLRLRNLVSLILHRLIASAHDKNEYKIAVIYLIVISNAYQFIDKNNMSLPLVAVDNTKQLECIGTLLYKVFSDFDLRHGLFEVLESYLEELDRHETTERLLNQLKGYFYVIAKKSERIHGDVVRFLLRLQEKQNSPATEIAVFLQKNLSY